MNDALIDKCNEIKKRIDEIDATLLTDTSGIQKLSRERGRLYPLYLAYEQWQQVMRDIADNTGLLEDPEVKDIAQSEIDLLRQQQTALEEKIYDLLAPDSEEDSRNCFIEIRAGVGGSESCLFCADLVRMYQRFAEHHQMKMEIISQSPVELAGYREIILRLIGEDAYGRMKFESGSHRVQRIPQTESQGRIHTSTCTVAVLPESDESDEVDVKPSDLRIDTFRASGAGGQHVNTTDSAIRILHIPTGLVVECQDERSQHKNKMRAMSVLHARIAKMQRDAAREKEDSTRRALVGSGDRSDRIRTYNFPQGRISDHRIGLTQYNLPEFMDGNIDSVIDALRKAYREQRFTL